MYHGLANRSVGFIVLLHLSMLMMLTQQIIAQCKDEHCQTMLNNIISEQDCTMKRILFVPLPDSSHLRDISEVAKATSLIMNAKCKGFDISQVQLLTVPLWKNVVDEIANHSRSEFFPHDQYFSTKFISNISDPNLIPRMKAMDGFRKTKTSKMERYVIGIDILSAAYTVVAQIVENTFLEDAELRLIKEERKQDILLVIDITAHSAIDYAQREGLNFVIVNIMPSVMFGVSAPQYLNRFPFTTTSLKKLESIYQEEGISKYLLTRLYEEIYVQGRIILAGIQSLKELNSMRRANNMPEKNEIAFTSSEKILIHFTYPGVLDYSYPLSQNNFLVGYKAKSKKKNHALKGKPKIFDDNMTKEGFDVMANNPEDKNLSDLDMTKWLDEKLEKKEQVVYVAFGTKLEIYEEHMSRILAYIVNSNENVDVICVYEGFEKLNLTSAISKKVLFQTWVNQPLILSHESIIAFITHAGAHSIFEAIDNQVPMLIFPVFGDQFSSAIRSEDLGLGYCISEDIYNQDEKSFAKNLKRVIVEKNEIKKRMREIKRINEVSFSVFQFIDSILTFC